jgi:hypothetical protein
MDALSADTGVGGLTAKLELSLFAVLGSLGASCRTLVTGITRDTHLHSQRQRVLQRVATKGGRDEGVP